MTYNTSGAQTVGDRSFVPLWYSTVPSVAKDAFKIKVNINDI